MPEVNRKRLEIFHHIRLIRSHLKGQSNNDVARERTGQEKLETTEWPGKIAKFNESPFCNHLQPVAVELCNFYRAAWNADAVLR